jgi:hypothetical protein
LALFCDGSEADGAVEASRKVLREQLGGELEAAPGNQIVSRWQKQPCRLTRL